MRNDSDLFEDIIDGVRRAFNSALIQNNLCLAPTWPQIETLQELDDLAEGSVVIGVYWHDDGSTERIAAQLLWDGWWCPYLEGNQSSGVILDTLDDIELVHTPKQLVGKRSNP